MSLRLKLLLGFVFLIALAGGKGFLAVDTISSTGKLAMDIYDRPLMAISFSKSVEIDFNVMERHVVETLIDADPDEITELEGELTDEIESLTEDMQVAVERLKTEAANKHAAEIKAAVLLWHKAAVGLIEKAKAGEKIHISGDFKELVESINEKMEALIDHANEVGFVARSEAEKSIEAAVLKNMIAMGIFPATAPMIAYLLGRAISNPINRIKSVMEELAEGISDEGDALEQMDDVPYTNRKDEIGGMAKTVQVFQDTARQVRKLQDDMVLREKAAIVEKEEAVAGALAGEKERAIENEKTREIEMARRGEQRHHRWTGRSMVVGEQFKVVNGRPGALRDTRKRGRLAEPAVALGDFDQPIGEHATAFTTEGGENDLDGFSWALGHNSWPGLLDSS